MCGFRRHFWRQSNYTDGWKRGSVEARTMTIHRTSIRITTIRMTTGRIDSETEMDKDDESVDAEHSESDAESDSESQYSTDEEEVRSYVNWTSVGTFVGSFLVMTAAVFGHELQLIWLDATTPGSVAPQSAPAPVVHLGPLPKMGPAHMYSMEDLIFSRQDENDTEESCQSSNSNNKFDPSCARNGPLVTKEMRQAFQRDGVIAIRGLIPPDLMDRLDVASDILVAQQQQQTSHSEKNSKKRSNTQFHTVRVGALFLDPPKQEIEGPLSAFRHVSLDSMVPQIAGQLLSTPEELSSLKNNNDTVRVIRDIFLAKDDDEYVCGWHVDDLGFWPATAEHAGVNAWIAIDDMPLESGGGFALAIGSHLAEWKEHAYRATGSSHTWPVEGYQSAADLVTNRTGAGTCNMQTAAPEINDRMEQTMRLYDIQKGDVIFHTRWLFHRTIPFDRQWLQQQQQQQQQPQQQQQQQQQQQPSGDVTDRLPLVYRRYSVRYSPSSAELPRGYGTELSILSNGENEGRTLQEVAERDGPWYPQCFPQVSPNEMNHLAELVETRLVVAEDIQTERKKHIQAQLKRGGGARTDNSRPRHPRLDSRKQKATPQPNE
eukprot:scaffold30067_cov49-Attheya_sp.AAC.2